MAKPRVSELLLHNFPENGVKYLLHNPANLGDLLRLLARRHTALPDVERFDVARRTVEPDTFVRGDFSHGVTDLLLKLPFRIDRRRSEWIRVYLLIEHLSAHQRHIVPRALGYVMDAYRLQERRWLQARQSLHGLVYEPVLPIVIYTGERPWQAPAAFGELVHGGDDLRPFIPAAEVLFLSLPAEPEQNLVEHGGPLGEALHVLKQRHATFEEFRRMLTKAAGDLDEQLHNSKNRLLELLSYLAALVYHFRSGPERDELRSELERSIRSLSVRKEIHAMGQTIAEELREEGKVEGKLEAKRQTLILLMRHKFGKKVTSALVSRIERTKDIDQLDQWLRNFATADSLEGVGIGKAS